MCEHPFANRTTIRIPRAPVELCKIFVEIIVDRATCAPALIPKKFNLRRKGYDVFYRKMLTKRGQALSETLLFAVNRHRPGHEDEYAFSRTKSPLVVMHVLRGCTCPDPPKTPAETRSLQTQALPFVLPSQQLLVIIKEPSLVSKVKGKLRKSL